MKRKGSTEPRLVWMRIDKIPPNPANPKEHDLDAIDASMDAFGFRSPCVFNDGSGLNSEGHGRVEVLLRRHADGRPAPRGVRGPNGKGAAKKGGVWTIPVIVGMPPFESPEHEEQWLAASNRLVERGGWNPEKLAALLRTVPEPQLLGFLPDEVGDLLKSIESDDPANAVQPEVDESAASGVKYATCPKCEHRFAL